MQRIVYLFIGFLLCYGGFVYADDLPKKDPCIQSAASALQLFKEEKRLFLFDPFQIKCYDEGNCEAEEFWKVTKSIDMLFDRTSAHAHMCLYGNNPKVESAWE